MTADTKLPWTTKVKCLAELSRLERVLLDVASDEMSVPGRAMFWQGWLASTVFHIMGQSISSVLTKEERAEVGLQVQQVLDASMRLCNRAAAEVAVTMAPLKDGIQ